MGDDNTVSLLGTSMTLTSKSECRRGWAIAWRGWSALRRKAAFKCAHHIEINRRVPHLRRPSRSEPGTLRMARQNQKCSSRMLYEGWMRTASHCFGSMRHAPARRNQLDRLSRRRLALGHLFFAALSSIQARTTFAGKIGSRDWRQQWHRSVSSGYRAHTVEG